MTTPWEAPGAREHFKVGTPLVFVGALSTHDGQIVAVLDDELGGRVYVVRSRRPGCGHRIDVGQSIIRDAGIPVLSCHLGQAYAKDKPLPTWVVERMASTAEDGE